MLSLRLLLLLFSVLSAFAVPTGLGARQFPPSSPHGPPGQLIEPVNGETYLSPGSITIRYKRSSANGYSTQSIQADVENIGGGPEALVINALESLNSGTSQYIEAVVAAPSGFCGDQIRQAFLVFETQIAPDGSIVQFQSASPTIHFTCTSGAYPPDISSHTGPHGTLLSPAPNTQYTNNAGAGVSVHVKYERLLSGLLTTLALQLALVQGAVSYELAFALGPTGVADLAIEQYFAAPGECLCGTWNLTVDEIQLFHNQLIAFQTYSIPLEFTCPASIITLCSG
ncbi:hypothetical protein CALVIDRAFT_526210 [Calocera viscosa TUFC12733]|uniref:Uncharacterized protein n=1 Tax=Calocera viscosa (strain TUFC12733) TaxID=1330018 RepID=A0A167P2M5_CALVF|nr:hypothetical protein CALVIDRAFT_526210 [Calocera viscosa TUFC12733]